MDCSVLRERLSDYLDGHIVEGERRVVGAHLKQCSHCESHFRELQQSRVSLRALASRPMPAKLAMSLRVLASRESERRRYAGLRGRLRWIGERVALFSNNLMKPLAMPLAGGLASAVILFSMVMTNFQGIMTRQTNDVPIVIATEATFMATPMTFDFEEVIMDLLVDENGRVVDYSFPDGYGSLQTGALRRKMEHSLLFAQFKPATTFGQPTTGWVRVSFRRSAIDVRG